MNKPSDERWKNLVVFALLAAATYTFQIGSGAYAGGVSRYMSDEPAHYVTGVMVHDYLAYGLGRSPMDFATEYYLHYPAVAMGHWPPMYYALEAVTFLLAGPSLEAALALNGALTALSAYLLFGILRSRIGLWPSLAAAVVLVAVTDVQQVTAHVMSEPMMCALGLGALKALMSYVEHERSRDFLAYGLLTGAAVLTKAVAWSLVPVPLALMLLTRRFDWLRSRAFWGAHALMLGIALPWELTMSQAVSAGFIASGAASWPSRAGLAVEGVTEQIGWPLVALGLGSAFAVAWRAWKGEVEATVYAPLALVCGGVFGLFVTAPVPPSPRYLILAFAGLLGLAALSLRDGAARILPDSKAGFAAAGGLLLLFLPWFGPGAKDGAEFEAVARKIVSGYDEHKVVLVSSQSGGELILVAEAARLESPPKRYFLRASKFLASTSWMAGGPYRSHVETVEHTSDRILGPPASLIVLHDDLPYREFDHHQLLREMVESDPQRWVLRETMDVRGYRLPNPGRVEIYELADFRDRPPGPIEVDMSHTLGRTLRLDPED